MTTPFRTRNFLLQKGMVTRLSLPLALARQLKLSFLQDPSKVAAGVEGVAKENDKLRKENQNLVGEMEALRVNVSLAFIFVITPARFMFLRQLKIA